MEWQPLYEAHGFCDEHRERLEQLSQKELMMLIPELAGCHPKASVLLKNKWLTAPQHILARVTEEYATRTRNYQRFRRDAEAECWLHALYCAVLAPLDNVAPEHISQAESFILGLFSDEELLAEIIGVGDTWFWHYNLNSALFQMVMKNAAGRPEYLRRRINEMLNAPDIDFSLNDIKWRLRFVSNDELKAVLMEFIC